jgi:hypothetical protein
MPKLDCAELAVFPEDQLMVGLFRDKSLLEQVLDVVGINDLIYAEFGDGPLNDRSRWIDATANGLRLFERVMVIAQELEPPNISMQSLGIRVDPACGARKKLRLVFCNSAVLQLWDGQPCRLESAEVVLPGKKKKGGGFDPAAIGHSFVEPLGREIQIVRDIVERIPAEWIPAGRNWAPPFDDLNAKLYDLFIGNVARLSCVVESARPAKEGRYRGFPQIRARMSDDRTLGLPVFLHAHFDGAREATTREALAHAKGDLITIRGTITRMALATQDGEACLNIELGSCIFAKPVGRTGTM